MDNLNDVLALYEFEPCFSTITIEDVLFDDIYISPKGLVLFTSEVDDFKIIQCVKQMGLHINIDLQNILAIQKRGKSYYELFITGSKYPIEDFGFCLESFSDYNDLDDIQHIKADIKSMENSNTNPNIKEYADGTTLIKNKNGGWVVASEKDTLEEFKKVLFGGIFGYHKFKEKKYLDAILFLLTGGLFCLGYLEEVILFWCGTKKDENGNYLKPLDLETKKMYIIPQILMIVFNIVLCMGLFWLYTNVL